MRAITLTILFILLAPAARTDVVYLKDGNSLTGTVSSVDETEVKMLLPYGTLSIKRQEVWRIDFGEVRADTSTSRPQTPVLERPPEKEPAREELEVGPDAAVVKVRKVKSPQSAAMLAIIPGGGYAYLERWDLAAAAAGVEIALAGAGTSLVSDEGEGKNSTGYVLLGFLGLLKVAEIFDSHERAVEWNKSLGVELGGQGKPFSIGLAVTF